MNYNKPLVTCELTYTESQSHRLFVILIYSKIIKMYAYLYAYMYWFLPRDSMLARYMPSSCVYLSVCLSVCLSVTFQYCIKTAKGRITQIMPHDSPVTRFLMPKVTAKFELGHPYGGDKCKWGGSKFATFDEKRANGTR